MNKKILTGVLVLCISGSLLQPVYADISYSGYLSELKGLLDQCQSRGIDTDYERINYAVIRKFESYLNQDEQQGVDSLQLAYNRAQIDRLYQEAKTNLQAYISGSKAPMSVTDYDFNQVRQQGNKLTTADGKDIYSIGYMGWGPVADDIEYYPDIAANNIMLEIGPTAVKGGMDGWEISDINKSKHSVVTGAGMVSEGNRALRISVGESSWSFVRQSVACEPNTTYEFCVDCKGSGVNRLSLAVANHEETTLKVGSQWTTNQVTIKTQPNETALHLNLLTYGKTSLIYLDKAVLKKAGSEENLLINGSFEDDTDYTGAATWKRNLLRAKENQLGVTMMLSPHYIPQDLPEEIYGDWRAPYNIDASETRTVIENYLRTILPHFQTLPTLTSICLSNEPRYDTRVFEKFYTPRFRDYLKSVHGDIATLNARYKTNYTSFDEVTMPLADSSNNSPQTAQFYDWMEFNDQTLAAWHKWMADIVKEYLPDVPVHAKVLHYNFPWAGDGLETLTRGTDIEMFNDFCDWVGQDLCDYTTNPELYYTVMMTYDYMNSLGNKPIYNSEDHIIPDKLTDFNEKERKHLRNNLWQGAIHGRDISSVWVWERSYDAKSDLYNSILHRPDCVAEAGKTALDLNRLSDAVSALDHQEKDVALFYSKPSQVYDNGAEIRLWQTYRNLIGCGLRVGVVSDRSIEALSKYKVLVIPRAYNCKPETLAAVNEFIRNGGKVFMQTGSFAKDQYNQSLDNSYLKSNSDSFNIWTYSTAFSSFQSYFERLGMLNIKVCKSDGTIPEGIEWEKLEKNGKLLVNITSITGDTADLHVEKNGEILSGATNLMTNEKVGETFTVSQYTPILLRFGKDEPIVPPVLTELWQKNQMLQWNTTGDAAGANIYRVTDDGLAYDGKSTAHTYPIQNATVFVRPTDRNGTEYDGKVLSVFSNQPITVSVENLTDHGNSVSYTLSLTNTAACPVKCIAAVRFMDGENAVKSTYLDVMLKAGENSRVEMVSEKAADTICAVAWDGIKAKQALSDEARYIISEN